MLLTQPKSRLATNKRPRDVVKRKADLNQLAIYLDTHLDRRVNRLRPLVSGDESIDPFKTRTLTDDSISSSIAALIVRPREPQ